MGFVKDHNTNISIYQLVQNRLPFLEVSTNNETLVSQFTMEFMYEFEVCFDIDKDDPEPSKIGFEENYSIPQQSLLADIVSVAILERFALEGLAGNVTTGQEAPTGTYVKKAGAGSAQVEFDQLDVRKGSTTMSLSAMLSNYKLSAIRRGTKLGCSLVFVEEGGITVGCSKCPTEPPPFIVVNC